MHIEVPDVAEATAVADLWAALAADQRGHGSHVDVEANREAALESVVSHTIGDEVLVARADGEDGDLLGFVMFGPESDRFVRTIDRGMIHNLYVVPEARGSGVGSALLSAAEKRLADRGLDVVVLSVLAANARARELYRERGYEPHRLEMERALEEGGKSDRDKTE